MSEYRGSFGDVPSDVALFDIEHRAHIGTTTPDDALSLFAVISDCRRQVAEAEADKSEAEERANGYAGEAEDLRERLSKLEDTDGTKGPDKSDLAEAVEIWRRRAEEAEAKLSRRAHKKAGK